MLDLIDELLQYYYGSINPCILFGIGAITGVNRQFIRAIDPVWQIIVSFLQRLRLSGGVVYAAPNHAGSQPASLKEIRSPERCPVIKRPTRHMTSSCAAERMRAKPARMRRRVHHALAAALLVAGSGGGCAALDRCGFGGCPGDAKINADVRVLFGQHPALEPPNLLRVQTLDRVVYLYGLVDTDLERQLAESVAREAPGVANVVNSIGISGNR
jgi:hypothetical protein